MNNKTLTIIFIALLGIFAVSKLFKGNTDSSFEKIVINIDTANVQKIVVHPKNSAESYSVIREGNEWKAERGSIEARANTSTVRSMLNTLSKIEIQRLAAKSRDKWQDYEVDEDNGVRIEVFGPSEKLEDFIVGRFNFDQQSRSATSYLRKTAEDDTYALDGFLSMTLNQGFDGVRDKTVLNFDKSSLSGIVLNEEGAQLSISKLNDQWSTSDGIPIDSTEMQQYLNGVYRLNASKFNDNADQLSLSQLGSLSFVSVNNTAETTIKIYRNENSFLLNSSLNNDALYESDSSGIYKILYTDLKDLIE